MTVLLSGIVLVGAFAFVVACCAGLVLAMYRVSARALPSDSAGPQATRTEATRPQANRPEASSARPGGQ
jgi:hypothetical protein